MFQGCRSRQATLRFREACLPWQRGRVDGDLAPRESARTSGGAKRAVRVGNVVAKPRTRRSPEPGARRERRRATVPCATEGISDRSGFLHRFTPASSKVDLGGFQFGLRRASDGARGEAATGMPEVRSPRVVTGAKVSPATKRKRVGPAEASRSDVNQAIPRKPRCESIPTSTGTNEARVLVRRREKAEVGPTHCAL